MNSLPTHIQAAAEAAAKDECFEFNGCFTGDCPHNSVQECGTHFFNEGVHWLFSHLCALSPEFDAHLPESYCRESGVSEYSAEGINFVKGARFQHSQMAAHVAALRAECAWYREKWNKNLTESAAEIERLRNDLELAQNVLKSKLAEKDTELDQLRQELADLQMVCRRLSAAKSIETRDKIAQQCLHLFKGNILRGGK